MKTDTDLYRELGELTKNKAEWICLDWNESALKVYRSIGAVPMCEWTVQRLDEQALKHFAEKK